MKCRQLSSNMPKAWYISHIVCFVDLHRSHSCRRRILYLLRLQEIYEFSLFLSCINLVQANFGNALMCYFSFSKHTLLYKFYGSFLYKLITERHGATKGKNFRKPDGRGDGNNTLRALISEGRAFFEHLNLDQNNFFATQAFA